MPYPEALVQPMRQELSQLGVSELTSKEEVDAAFEGATDGTMLLIINSVCGCAAANARPAVALVKQTSVQPDAYTTVFAGQDLEATSRAREHLAGIPPSSPFMALVKDGEPVFVLERRHIEGRSANAIAGDLKDAFEKYCGADSAGNGEVERPESDQTPEVDNGLPPTFRSIR